MEFTLFWWLLAGLCVVYPVALMAMSSRGYVRRSERATGVHHLRDSGGFDDNKLRRTG